MPCITTMWPGLVQDDTSLLLQPTSMSVNSDAIVEISNASDLGNGEFLVWGNDNDDDGTITQISTESPAGMVNRLDREWQVVETGDVGTTTVSFDLTGITVSGTSAADFNLLIDSVDSDFGNGVTQTIAASSFSGNVVTFTGVDFADGDFFTLNTGNTVTIGGVINDYAPVSSINGSAFGVDDATGFMAGDTVLIIQMQGATLDGNGIITDIGSAGLYEFNTIDSVMGTTINLQNPTINTYLETGAVQTGPGAHLHRRRHRHQ